MLRKFVVLAGVVAAIGCKAPMKSADAARDDLSQPAATRPADAAAQPAAANGEVRPTPDHNAATADDKAAGGNAVSRLFTKKPEYREVTLPAGTEIPITLETALASDTSRVEEPVRARVQRAILIQGVDAVPEGSTLTGAVTEARRSARVKGRARIAFRLTTLQPANSDERVSVRTALVGRTAPATKQKDAAKIGIPAGVGAIIGGVVGGGKGAAKGAAIGGSAGTGYVLATRGQEVRLPVGTALVVKTAEPVTLRVPLKK